MPRLTQLELQKKLLLFDNHIQSEVCSKQFSLSVTLNPHLDFKNATGGGVCFALKMMNCKIFTGEDLLKRLNYHETFYDVTKSILFNLRHSFL